MTDIEKTRRLVFCFDGTFNKLSANVPTNVAKIAQIVRPIARDGKAQIVYYDEGIGTGVGGFRRLAQGAFGWGMLPILRDAYRFLIFNYRPGDQIYAFGFSRGAFTARSFLGFVRHAGILDVVSASHIDKAIEIYRRAPAGRTGLESGEALRFRARHCTASCVSEVDREFRRRVHPDTDWSAIPLINIRYLGVWDTVSALGWPQALPGATWFNRKYRFHDATLTSKISAARHAVALDEESLFFPATLFGEDKVTQLNGAREAHEKRKFADWEMPYQERWFPGIHGSVGGGGPRKGIPDAALFWVLTGARRAGLDVRSDVGSKVFEIEPNSLDFLRNTAPKQSLPSRMARAIKRDLELPFVAPRVAPSSLNSLSLAALQRMSAPADALESEDTPHSYPGSFAARVLSAIRKQWRRFRKLPDDPRIGYMPKALSDAPELISQWPYAGKMEVKSGYMIKSGQSLRQIADDVWQDPERYLDIFEANRDRLDDPSYYPAGIVLRVDRD